MDDVWQSTLTMEEVLAEGGTLLPSKEVLSLLDLNVDLDLALDLAAPIDLAVAGNLNIAAPITGAVSAELAQGKSISPEGQAHMPGVMTHPAATEVDYPYSREDLRELFETAYAEDVEKGGRYDGRSGAINVYTHPWNDETMRTESTLMGTFYVVWGQGNCIWKIEVDEGFSFEDLLVELGTLEEKALGVQSLREDRDGRRH